MSWEDEFPDWFRLGRRRRLPFFSGFSGDIDKMMEEMFADMAANLPKDLVRERRMPDGSIVRESGPFVYGYSMTVGPDGKPVIREFGNVKPSMRPGFLGMPKPELEARQEREPLVDIISDEKTVKVVAELPGVEKSDIKLQCTETMLAISVETERRKYYRELELPAQVDPNSSKASYRNGVLEVTLAKLKPGPKGKEIEIE